MDNFVCSLCGAESIACETRGNQIVSICRNCDYEEYFPLKEQQSAHQIKFTPSHSLLDSGARHEFKTGAVRDLSKGKGRCDLLPLDTVEQILKNYEHWSDIRMDTTTPMPTVLMSINLYMDTLDTTCLSNAVCRFIDDAYKCDIYEALMELSKHYEAGAEKYYPNNWKLGIDQHCFINSAVRHYLKYLRKDIDEPHDRAVLWNLIGAIWTHDNHPELNDVIMYIPSYKTINEVRNEAKLIQINEYGKPIFAQET